MSAEVCFAARMPASRAACSGSPFLTAPARMSRRASRDIAIEPRAIASRSVTGFSPTSTILTPPRASTCDSLPTVGLPALLPFCPPALLLLAITLFLGEKKGKALERHREVDAFQLHVGGDLQRARRKVQHGFDA